MSAERRGATTNKTPTARVFFALWPPADMAAQLGEIARRAAADYGGRAARAETIHLTLAFLGDVPEARLPELLAVAEWVKAEAFSLSVDHLGFWSHNRLLWAGCRVPAAGLAQVVLRLNETLAGAGFRTERPSKDFKPHITLVRRIPANSAPTRSSMESIGPLHWPCTHFCLVRSTLTGTGSRYEMLADFPLGGATGGR